MTRLPRAAANGDARGLGAARSDASAAAGATPAAASGDEGGRRDPFGGGPAAWRLITALARRARAGDGAALLLLHGALAQRHAARVWHGRACQADPPGGLERADLEQQAFVVLLETLRSWPGEADFAGWYARAARWSLGRYARQRSGAAAAPPAASSQADLAGMAAERADCSALLVQLSAVQRAVLRWRFWQDLTFEQMAERYGIPAASAHDYYRRALARLRRLLGVSSARRRRGGDGRDRDRDGSRLAR